MTDGFGGIPRFRQGAGRLCLDFVRTLRHRGTPAQTEELSGPEALAAWAAQCGPCGARSRRVPTAAGVRSARLLREDVYALLTGAAAGRAADPGGRERLNAAAARPVPVPRLTAAGALEWHSERPVTATLALVARDALGLAAEPGLLSRLHQCASPDCGALFLDASRPGTRRWCSMDRCGNRAKKAALRARA